MYWYYKYAFLLIFILLLTGVSVLVWRSYVSPFIGEGVDGKEPAMETAPVALPPAIPGDAPTPPLPPPSSPVDGVVETVPPKPGPTYLPDNVRLGIAEAEKCLREDNPKEARRLAKSLLTAENCSEYDASWMALADLINRANRIFMNSKAPSPEKQTYVIQSGDTLTRIAYTKNTTVGALQRLNGLPGTSAVIHAGQTLQYIDGHWTIKISKQHYLLTLYFDDSLYRIYHVSIGKEDRTPVGVFVIKDKLMNPPWTPPGKMIPFGDPRNILGTRWMGLKPVAGTDQAHMGYGIHGTTEPETIGKSASLGCIRMLNEDVEELYDFIPSSFAKLDIHVFITE